MPVKSNLTEIENILNLTWVAYAPTNANPETGVQPTLESVEQDLKTLSKAGFDALVTYGADGILGEKLPEIAKAQGFKGLIIGIWNFQNETELTNAKASAHLEIVKGYCVGNEGLGTRYSLEKLKVAIDKLQTETGKPVTTTEQLEDYSDEKLLQLGDWVFPNIHPYWHGKHEVNAAVEWTKAAFDDLKQRSGKVVLCKEVGFPTAGNEKQGMSEELQEEYYTKLVSQPIDFVWFEAFDQPWKDHQPVEPFWGLFRSDRSPKRIAHKLMGNPYPFYVYEDYNSSKNHFFPSGFMGDCGDVLIEENHTSNPHAGNSCIRISYAAKGNGPNECPYSPPCKWAGIFWQHPISNWGISKVWAGKGYDLSAYNRLTFWARADKRCQMEFKVGGIDEAYGDSQRYPKAVKVSLEQDWKQFEIKLNDANLEHIIGGFCFVTNWDTNPSGAIFYLDEIRFEKK